MSKIFTLQSYAFILTLPVGIYEQEISWAKERPAHQGRKIAHREVVPPKANSTDSHPGYPYDNSDHAFTPKLSKMPQERVG